jgi:hypothetical protein
VPILISLLIIVIVAEAILLIRLWPKKPPKIIKPPIVGKVALVIDDWGYNLDNLPTLQKIDRPITISILPNLTYSTQIAEEARQRKCEVILHLPLEPHKEQHQNKFRIESGTILCGMPKREVIEQLNRALRSVPYISGVSNHMGSKATEDEKLMKIIFKEIKEKNLYFLDSLVTNKSICKSLSKKMRLKFAQRDIFLDNEEELEYIKRQLQSLVLLAKKDGSAIGVGHDKEITLNVIKEVISQLEGEGIKFVYLSELVQ